MAAYSQIRVRQLIRESDEAPNSDVKGEKLESLVRYIFEKFRGISFAGRNILDGVRAHELDVVFKNDIRKSDLYFLEDFLLITECKNTEQPVGSNDVRWFISKLQDRAARSGILISLSGITGRADGISNAHSEIINALNRDKIRLLTLNRDELLSLTTTADLADLLHQKILTLTIERTVH